ncbi:E3 ubiquitin-protein ligase RNF180-like [Polistes fuscatus]|uniref:E3 ubiquitin-protein ligase RNF180-like n=1 Tax=Polistes fuscatus TaxID=30207 RepID=UPI001CA88FBB|nr:E3 ubiquitin-protein ligase RNF180-like [Polistes fuscatus]
MIEIRCKHCCKNLFQNESFTLLSSHNEDINNIEHTECGGDFIEHCLYMSMENLPTWIQKIIDQTSWTKGRLNCPFCNTRLGSFNLVIDTKCNCGTCIMPPIRLIRSKLDVINDNDNKLTVLTKMYKNMNLKIPK